MVDFASAKKKGVEVLKVERKREKLGKKRKAGHNSNRGQPSSIRV